MPIGVAPTAWGNVLATEPPAVNGRTQHRRRCIPAAHIWARAAHDLRQPVQVMLLQMQMLDEPSSRAERRRAVRQIETALLSLRDMLEVLAQLSRIEAGLQAVSLRTCSLAEILGPIAGEMAEVAQARGARLRCRRTRALVRSHPKLLAMAIRSLFLNAIELGTGGDIAAGCRRRGDGIAFEVSFGGGTHDPARRANAFVTLSEQAGEAAPGRLGLGLDLLQHLCRHLGHDLEARSEAGGIQSFTIGLPRATAAR